MKKDNIDELLSWFNLVLFRAIEQSLKPTEQARKAHSVIAAIKQHLLDQYISK